MKDSEFDRCAETPAERRPSGEWLKPLVPEIGESDLKDRLRAAAWWADQKHVGTDG